MKFISDLARQYLLLKADIIEIPPLIDWAIERLCLDEDECDMNIALLASSKAKDEVMPLTETILEKYGDEACMDEQFVAGLYMLSLYEDYICGKQNINKLDTIISSLYNYLGYPDWLSVLTRNCEYATDIGDFKKPFELEFNYIANLWKSVKNSKDFHIVYKSEISRKHDLSFDMFNALFITHNLN